jgi:hypothetical protein
LLSRHHSSPKHHSPSEITHEGCRDRQKGQQSNKSGRDICAHGMRSENRHCGQTLRTCDTSEKLQALLARKPRPPIPGVCRMVHTVVFLSDSTCQPSDLYSRNILQLRVRSSLCGGSHLFFFCGDGCHCPATRRVRVRHCAGAALRWTHSILSALLQSPGLQPQSRPRDPCGTRRSSRAARSHPGRRCWRRTRVNGPHQPTAACA